MSAMKCPNNENLREYIFEDKGTAHGQLYRNNILQENINRTCEAGYASRVHVLVVVDVSDVVVVC
jgi:hypothetical protein